MIILQGPMYRLLAVTRAVGGVYTFLGGIICLIALLVACNDQTSWHKDAVAMQFGGGVLLVPGLIMLWLARQLDRKRLLAFYGIAAAACFQIVLCAGVLVLASGHRAISFILIFCYQPAICLIAYPDFQRLRRQQQRDKAFPLPNVPEPAAEARPITAVPPPPFRHAGARHRAE